MPLPLLAKREHAGSYRRPLFGRIAVARGSTLQNILLKSVVSYASIPQSLYMSFSHRKMAAAVGTADRLPGP